VWSRSVGLVMEDSQLQSRQSCETPSSDLGRIRQLVVQRTPDWVKGTVEKLCVLLKRIISCTSAHQHWRVRLEMVELADHLLATCGQSLKECVGPLLEALVGAINDDEPRRNQSGTASKNLTDVLSENLHSLATSLPRLMRTSDDQKKLFVLNVFLGYYGNIYLLTDHLLDLYRQSSAYRKPAAMVLNEMVRGAAGIAVAAPANRLDGSEFQGRCASTEDLKATVVSILEEYTSLNNWHLKTVSEETDTDRQDQKLEGVACFAQALRRDFRPLLMTSLYPVLEKAGEDTLLVSQAALSTMMDISKACGYSSLKDLINDNSDYLLNDISVNLQRLSQHPQVQIQRKIMAEHICSGLSNLVASFSHPADQAPRVLTVMLAHSDCSLLPLIRDIVQDVLMALDLSYDHSAALFCSVLHALMKALGKDIMQPISQGIVSHHLKPASLVIRFLIVGCILCPCPKVLDVLEQCVYVLSEREDELLPMAHRCWPALLQRLTDDPLAVLRAFRVLCTLGENCGDFLRRRVSKEVLPKLSSSLARQAPVSAKAGPVYTHTLAYKLQLAVLQGLGSLCQRLNLSEADLDAVCEACLPYLSCRQPIRLQEACLR
ncbi:hypothetical protein XENOCAPTIV_005999, partial [Xenoophorus captivus]